MEKRLLKMTDKGNISFLKEEEISLKLDFIDILLNFTIPIFVIMQIKSGFFILNILVIFFRIRLLAKNFRIMSLKNRIFQVLMTFVWTGYHLTFCILYFLEILKEKNYTTITWIGKYCG